MATPEQLVVVGRISGIYGVRGWVRVQSFTAPVENLFDYGHWHLRRPQGWQPIEVLEAKPHGKGFVAELEGLDDREEARALIGAEIAVPRAELPPAEPGEYYWSDLEGLRVETLAGVSLGTVDHLLETGANDVLVVNGEDRQRLIPYVTGQVIEEVNLDAGLIRVDWDPDF